MEKEMVIREFNKADLRDIAWEDHAEYEVMEDKIIDTSRWSIIHNLIFKEISTGKFYETTYSVGATEVQDEAPFEDHDGECIEVEPYKETVIKYKPVTPIFSK